MKSAVPEVAPTVPSAGPEAVVPLVTATAQALPEQLNALARARAFAEPLIAAENLETGENTLAHADAVAAILKTIGGSEAMQAAHPVSCYKKAASPIQGKRP